MPKDNLSDGLILRTVRPSTILQNNGGGGRFRLMETPIVGFAVRSTHLLRSAHCGLRREEYSSSAQRPLWASP
ncbi:hypothetical protein RRG08_016692 [Elysia crispata]|uniref:Uncharacterized protein n=1 Tax=Elysia crispata TaxID=231223 RepID=A0AAE1AJA0_9GAST|nr:hypothetical protein RRG08_016692 [Elysia crispata]